MQNEKPLSLMAVPRLPGVGVFEVEGESEGLTPGLRNLSSVVWRRFDVLFIGSGLVVSGVCLSEPG